MKHIRKCILLLICLLTASAGLSACSSKEEQKQDVTQTEKQMNMKKVSKTLAVALIALSAMYIKSMTKEQSAHELLLLNNIEALASGEDNNLDKADYYCYGRGNIDCPISGEKVNTVIKVYSLD